MKFTRLSLGKISAEVKIEENDVKIEIEEVTEEEESLDGRKTLCIYSMMSFNKIIDYNDNDSNKLLLSLPCCLSNIMFAIIKNHLIENFVLINVKRKILNIKIQQQNLIHHLHQ